MKVSLNWIKGYLDFELPPVDELVQRIGSQLGAVEEVIDIGAQYQGIVIVRVVECQRIEGSDHLQVCKIDDGGLAKDVERDVTGYIQVVCGAPNVRPGIMAVWLPPSSTVPSTYNKEPLVLEARQLHGVISNGMLASAKELAIGDNHDGVLELDAASSDTAIKSQNVSALEAVHNYLEEPNIKPGDDFAKAYKLDDTVIDIENKMFTHRPDCFGMLGVAREIAGILGRSFTSPLIYREPKTVPSSEVTDLLEIRNEIPDLVPRFVAQVFLNVSIAPSPLSLQTMLSRVGVRPINNVVDYTNYFMLVTGQPLHAYDYDKVKAQDPGAQRATLTVRFPHTGERLRLINGKEIELSGEAIIIASATKAVGLGGVMGGTDTEVDNKTANIILECASFDMYSIRRTSMDYGIFSDAVSRFNKGQSPLQNDRVVAWTRDQLVRDTGASPTELIDLNRLAVEVRKRDSLFLPVNVTNQFINDRLGLNLSTDEMEGLLGNVEFSVTTSGDELVITAPFWRTDIELREDIVEEIGRLYGYDKLPLRLPQRDVTPAKKDQLIELKQQIRNSLSRAGANEVLSYSFIHGKLFDRVTQNRDEAFKLARALSPELQYYRLHALPSLLDKVHANVKAGYEEFALFELNKGHNLRHKDDDNGVPTEIEFLDFVYVNNKKSSRSAFFMARRYLDALAKDNGLHFDYMPIDQDPHVPVSDPYDYRRSAFVSVVGSGEFLGMVGELKASILRDLKLPRQTAAFTIGPQQLKDALSHAPASYIPLPRFPKVEQDICLKVSATLSYRQLYDFVLSELNRLRPVHSHFSLSPLDIYQRPDEVKYKQITFRLSIASYDKTMTDTEINKLLDDIAQGAQTQLAATRI